LAYWWTLSEYLKAIPDKLESLMSEKRLLPAAALLVSSLKVIGKPDMIEIGALSDLRSYLFSQETVSKPLNS
jgi:exocyst complex component 4